MGARTRSALAAAWLAAAGSVAVAADPCVLLDTAEVSRSLGVGQVRVLSADPAGLCSFGVGPGRTLMVQVQRRPDNAAAAAFYETFEQSVFAKLTRARGEAGLGSRSVEGLSSEGARMNEAAVLALEGTDTISVRLMAAMGVAPGPKALEGLRNLAALAIERRARARQSFGRCDWVTPGHLDALFGKGTRTVQAMGTSTCIVSSQPGDGVLVIRTGGAPNPRSVAALRERANRSCRSLDLGTLHPGAYASYACPAPGNKAMRVAAVSGETQLTIDYVPGGRAALEADIEPLKPVIRYALDRL
ncbi:MAG: hypothetical protein KDH20_03080 [Rhodocyclaceae bacterium]|nr:hypothetical protein [Rhodocyclaceae bacterium]